MDLAKSFIVDEHLASGNVDSGGGIEQFATVIDHIIARIKFVFEDVVLRIESYNVDSGLCTGIEIQIDRMEFLDEVIDELITTNNVVTEQPDRRNDLNKLINVQGVRLYTDIWTPIRPQRLNTSQIVSSDSEPDIDPMGNSSLNFQSCYSHFSSRSNSNTATRLPINSISPNPVLFAQLFSEKHTIQIRTNNNGGSSNVASTSEDARFNNRIEIDVNLFSPLYALLTASQIDMLKSLFMSLLPKPKQQIQSTSNFTGGMPMKEEHFTRMMNQIQNEFVGGNTSYVPEKNSGAGFLYSTGTWSGVNEPQFFDLSEQHDLHTFTDLKHGLRTPIDQQRLTSNSLHHDWKNVNNSAKKNGRIDSSASTLVDFRLDIFMISIRAPAALVIVAHHDPLSVDSLKEHNNDFTTINQLIQKNINEMAEKAEHFFKMAQSLKLDKAMIDEQKALLLDLYPNSHMRILAHKFYIKYNATNNMHVNSLEIKGSLNGCDIVEILKPTEQTRLVEFSGNTHSDSAISFRLLNLSEKPQQRDYSLFIEVGVCKLEIDPSIIDRFGTFFTSRPFFYDYKNQLMKQSVLNETSTIDHGILSDLFENDTQPISLNITCTLKKLLLIIRVPNTASPNSDCEMNDYFPCLHNEVLQFDIEGTTIELPKSLLTDLQICGTVNLKCQTLKGSFIGDSTVLKCSQEQMNFLFVDTTNADKAMGNVQAVMLNFTYDLRDKSLSRALLLNSINLSHSFPESVFNSTCANEKKIEGPFSTKDVFHFKDNSSKKKGVKGEEENPSQTLVKAGSRAELLEFAEDCRAFSNLVFDLTFANVNLALPSREFFHYLFNRYLFDLTHWRPKSSKFSSSKDGLIGNKQQFIECHSAFLPFRNSENDLESSSDEILDEANISDPESSKNKKRRLNAENNVGSHNFSIGIHFERARCLLQKDLTGLITPPFNACEGQLGTEMLNGDLFLVDGFKGSSNISYMFLTSSNAQIFHKNLPGDKETPFGANVLDNSTFLFPKNRSNVQMCELPKDHPTFEKIEDDNFVCSMRTTDLLLAVGLRNSLLYLRPIVNLQLFWPLQFLKFFDCDDLFNPGYRPPTTKIDLRFHCTNVLLGYDHSSIQQNSPFQLRFEIGSSYVSTYLKKNLDRLTLDCIFEDLILWMRKKQMESVSFEPINTRFFNSDNIFIKMLAADSIHFVLGYLLQNTSNQENNNPAIDFACIDQNLTLWLCSDTLIEFITIIIELFNSETLKTLFASLNSTVNDTNLTNLNSDNIDIEQSDTGFPSRIDSINDDQQLIREMEAAISDMPPIYRANDITIERCAMTDSVFDQKMFDALSDESEDEEKIAEDEDSDEFTFIELPSEVSKGSTSVSKNGVDRPSVTQLKEGRFHTNFDAIGGFEFIAKTIRIEPVNSEQNNKLPSSAIKMSYKISFSSLKILIFGGSDFCDSARHLPQCGYSQWDSNRRECSANAENDYGSKGGRYRDHTVFIEFKFSKLSAVCKFFNEEVFPYHFSFLLELGDLNILDHLEISHINEMIHRLQIEGQPRSQGHFLKFFLREDQLREAIVRISLAPIRLNLDQDTFDFLVDFKNQLVQFSKNIFENLPSTSANVNNAEDEDVPIMEIPPQRTNDESEEMRNSFCPEFSEEGCSSISFNKLRQQDEADLADLFSEDDVDFSVFNEKDRNCKVSSRQSSNKANERFQSRRLSQISTATMHQATSKKALAAKDIFIKDFSFSPACLIRMDYEAKRIRTDQQQSAFLSLLLGMTNMKKAELTLKEIRVEKGFLGARKCIQFVVDEWKNDIIDKQLRNLVGGVAMINAVVLLAQGLSDLVTYPLEEYQRVDGQLSRGIQKGTTSFGLNVASAALDATQRVTSFVHNVAEFTYDILNPNFTYQHYNADHRTKTPGDLREGISLACNTVKEGLSDTAQTLQTAAEQDRARGGWGVGILRHIAPTAVRPIVIATKATVHMLGGLKNQLKPEEHREEMRKWRRNSIRISNGEQLQRQMSAPSSISSNFSSSSLTHISYNPQTPSSSQMSWQKKK
ncbi:unnamed protein product [Meloidogyne enterolobii]|uniref:Uncharacterized protein n=2 Tax=Meloidogyne enterolobii TaxID=390850 RepID=A0ACB1AKQ4_MELEN